MASRRETYHPRYKEPRPRVYHPTVGRLSDNPYMTVDDWRAVWHAYQAFRHQVRLIGESAERRALEATDGSR
jgi:hypothetical protein